MSKLIFRYSAMNSGKTTNAIQLLYNYNERGMKTLLVKPQIDAKGDNKIVSRIGVDRKVDLLLDNNTLLSKYIIKHALSNLSCVVIDEAQFIQSKEQIDDLLFVSHMMNIPVVCYGLRTDFSNNGFLAATRLLEISDELEELPTICRCGKKARFNSRRINGKTVFNGSQVCIDNKDDVRYESLCAKCYMEERLKVTGEYY